MVALNFQTSGKLRDNIMKSAWDTYVYFFLCVHIDVPVQINHAKFEFNGNTGYLYKPWVMNREGAAKGVFNPFVQSKLEDIVPAKLQVKVGIIVLCVFTCKMRCKIEWLYSYNYVCTFKNCPM